MKKVTNSINFDIKPEHQGELALVLEIFTEAWTKKASKDIVNMIANKYSMTVSEVEAFEKSCEKDFVAVFNKFKLAM